MLPVPSSEVNLCVIIYLTRRGDVHTNTVEGIWSLFKRSVVGSYNKVSHKCLDSYLDELEWRFNNRDNPYLFRDIEFDAFVVKYNLRKFGVWKKVPIQIWLFSIYKFNVFLCHIYPR